MSIRADLTREQRVAPLIHTIDPGFVHHGKIEAIVGTVGMQVIDDAINRLPDLPEWQRNVRIDHIYTRTMLMVCSAMGVKPLGDLLAKERGRIFCSTEELEGFPDFYEAERAVSVWASSGAYPNRVEFHYSTNRISSDTLRGRLRQGGIFSIVAELYRRRDNVLIFDPIIIGSPWLEQGDIQIDFDPMWWGFEFYENFIEDIDEFARVAGIPTPGSPEPMRHISEAAFKACLAQILGDAVHGDWGGETSDYYSAHIHLSGRRTTAAFLFKGPAHFAPMGLNHLGHNNDQIVRLADEPAGLFVVQHCHDILPPVRKTLRAFAVQPSNPRRYCLIDGRDSLRLLQGYDLYDRALELSRPRRG